ncbi:polyketide cyclase / dehydrase family protein [Frankia torreyi]|uniref:Polyketide cyclase / dehydrase family protein n=1 Tax=Frankia torreyi TaxID=1856 RepID=A0A0D8BHE9_9ACTN|nr:MULTISPECIES: SRPBCC family protein [Frankia]KJE23399.1 polyketide cyclase / dehydrase family protein [Frankia torreyi]KQM05438.1 polyketide cyclase / dehydrase family protein [Frankia sp. CpI1-P]
MTQTTAKQTGIIGALRENPATKNLVDQAKNLAKARGAQLVGKTTERLTSSTEKLNVLADQGGAVSALKAGSQQLASGKSPLRAAFATAASAAKDKVTSVLHLGGKGSGGKGGPPKATNIEETIDVGVPVSVAYDQWTQYPQFSRFMKGVEAVDAKSETEQNWRVKVFKSRRTWAAKVQEQIPDRRIVWTSEGPKGSTKGAVTFHPLADDLTRVLLAMEYYPSGLMEKIGNIWRAGGRRARLDLKHFRRYITMQGEASGSWRGVIRDGEVVQQPDEGEQGAEESEGTRDADDAADSGRGDAGRPAGATPGPSDEDTGGESEQTSDAEARPKASVGG